MEKLKVKNAKNFALTVGEEYDVISKDGNRLEIKNDKGNRAFYYPSVFEEATPPPPPAPVVNLETIINSINTTATQIRFAVGDAQKHIACNLPNDESHNSCGIRVLSGVNNMYEVIEDIVGTLEMLSVAEKRTLVMKMFSAKLKQRVHANTGAMAMLSTNMNFSNFSEIDQIITEAYPSGSALIATNENGGNDIKTWLVPLD